MTAYWLERAVIGGSVADAVRVTVAEGRFTAVETGVEAEGATRLAGLTVPGLANCHSHAFHRALRGRTQRGRGTFWTWREQMYDVAGRLDPDTYRELARAVYREMALGGITTVGEFHYLHHGPDGTPYDDPNAMGRALLEAGAEAGVRVVLLDTCYLAAGIGREPEGVQRRFSDGTAEAWAARVDDLHREVTSRATRRQEGWGSGLSAVGAAVHSVRAVPRDQVPVVARWATSHQAPLHVHLSEQVAENDECRAAHGMTPTELLDAAGALGPQTSAVHATHLTHSDVALLGGSATAACFCPTTERDLGDGIGPSRALFEAGVAAHPRVGQPRGARPVRGDACRRARRAARHPGARPLDRGRAARGRHRRRAPLPRAARRRPDRGRRPGRPGHLGPGEPAHGREPVPTRELRCSPRPPPTSCTWCATGWWSPPATTATTWVPSWTA